MNLCGAPSSAVQIPFSFSFVYNPPSNFPLQTWDLELSWCLILCWIYVTVPGNWNLSLNQEIKLLSRSCSHRPHFFQNNDHIGQRDAEVSCATGIDELAEVPRYSQLCQ